MIHFRYEVRGNVPKHDGHNDQLLYQGNSKLAVLKAIRDCRQMNMIYTVTFYGGL